MSWLSDQNIGATTSSATATPKKGSRKRAERMTSVLVIGAISARPNRTAGTAPPAPRLIPMASRRTATAAIGARKKVRLRKRRLSGLCSMRISSIGTRSGTRIEARGPSSKASAVINHLRQATTT